MKKSTIYDVAKQAGVSPATVSRVFNQSGYVGMATRRRVEDAARKLHYVPAATTVIDGRHSSRAVGVLVPDIRYEHCAAMVFYIEAELSQHGYSCILCNANGSYEKAIGDMALLLQRKVEGLILVNSFFAEKPVAEWLRNRMPLVPVVMVYGKIDLPNVYSVLVDIPGALEKMVRHFAQKGKTRLAFVQSRMVRGSRWQRRAFEKAVLEHLAQVQPISLTVQRASIADGYQATNQLMTEHPLLNGIIFDSSLSAIGGCRYCQDQGLQIPKDIGICATDMLSCAEIVRPAIACGDTKQELMGREAARTMLDLLCGQERPRSLVLSIDGILERETL